MSDLKIDARLKEINIKIRAMEGEQTRRRLEAANGLNDELHAVDDKFHEDMKSLKERYMQERQSIEDRYFADRKAIDKEYEDKRLDLIDSIKEVIGDISEVVGFEPSKSVEPISNFESVNNEYTSIFDNKESLNDNEAVEPASTIQTPLTSIEDIEESLEEVTNGFAPIEPVIEEVNVPEFDNTVLNLEVPEINNISIEEPVIQEPAVENEVINQNVVVEPVISYPTETAPVIEQNVVEVTNSMPVQQLEEVPITPVVDQPIIDTVPVMQTPQVIPAMEMQASPIVSEPVVDQTIPAPQQAIANVTQDINASIDNALDDINSGIN